MSLMDAPTYDPTHENRVRAALIASGVLLLLLVLLTLAGYIVGHGWLFTNLPAEHRVNNFFKALEAKDYGKAYAIYNNDDGHNHPDYTLARFTEDWTTQSPVHAAITEHHVDISRTDGKGAFGTGIIVAVRVNGSNKVFMYYIKSDGTLTWPAPHELEYNP